MANRFAQFNQPQADQSQLEVKTDKPNRFARFAQERFSPDTIKEIQTLNGNPQQKETVNVLGRNFEGEKGFAERLFNVVTRSYDKGTIDTELNLTYAKVLLGDDSPETKARIAELEKQTVGNIPVEGNTEYVAQVIAEQMPQILRMIANVGEKGLAGTIGGIAMGSLGGIPGMVAGATGGATVGTYFGMAEHAFRLEAGSAFAEYSKFKDDEGNLLSPEAARVGAIMAGLVNAGYELIPTTIMFRMIPGAGKLLEKAGLKATEAFVFPKTTGAMKTFLFNIAKIMAAEGSQEIAQEDVTIKIGEVLKEFSDREFEPITTEEYWSRIKESGIKGAIVGGALGAVPAGARFVADVAAKPAEEGVVTEEAKLRRGVEAVKEEVKPEEVTEKTIVETAEKAEAIVKEIKEKPTPEQITEVAETLKAIAPSKEAVDTIIKGRIDKLDTDILNIDNQIDNIDRQIVDRQKGDLFVRGKRKTQPVKALENRRAKLLNQRETLDESRANLLTAEEQIVAASKIEALTEKDIRALEVRKEKIEVKGEKIIKLEEQSLKAQERALGKGFREGARATKGNIKQAKKNLRDLLNKTSLPAKSKDKIKALAELETEEDFISKLPEIRRLIAREFERLEVSKQKKRIENALDPQKIKARKVSGVKQGKFDAEIQTVLDNLSGLLQTSGKVNPKTGESEASLLLAERIDKQIFDPLGNTILNLKANPRSVPSPQIRAIANVLDILTSEGREAAKARILARQIEVQAFADGINEFVSKGEDIKLWKRTGSGAQFRTAKNFTRQVLADVVDSWDEITDRILPESEAQKLDIINEESHELAIKERMLNRFTNAAEDAYGIKDGRKLRNLLDDTNRVKDHGLFINNRGEQVRLEMSKSEAMTIYMQWQDPTLKETLTGEDQLADPDIENKDIKGNAYSREMLTYIFNTIMDPKDQSLGDNMLDIYAEFYPEINEVYSKVLGIDLDNNPRYSPIHRQVDTNKTDIDVFGVDIAHRSKITNPRSIKARQNSIKPLLRRSALDVYTNHINEMSRFIALREKTQLLNAIFSQADVRETLRIRYGNDFNRAVGSHLESFASGARDISNPFLKLVNYLNRNFAASALGGKAKIGFTQTISLFAYAEFMPSSAFIEGVREFALNPAKAIKMLAHTQTIKNRGYSIDVDIARMGKVFDNKTLQRLQKKQDQMIDYMLIPTKIGDRFPIYAGGGALYSYVLKKTGSKQKATEAFEQATETTQQSKRVSRMSLVQKGNPLLRGLAMFMSAPIAQLRGEMRAMRKFIVKGEINKRQFVKNMLIYHFILPGLYQAIANGIVFGEWDEDDQIRAAVFGSFNAFLVFGDILNSVYREIQGKRSRKGDVLKWARPLKDMMVDLIEAFQSGKEGDFEEMTESIYDALVNTGSLTGLPAPQIDNVIKGIEDLEDGELESATQRFLGWPDGVVNKGERKEIKLPR